MRKLFTDERCIVWQKFAVVSQKHTAYTYHYTLKIEVTISP